MVTINVKQLHEEMPRVIRAVRQGKRVNVTYRKKPVFSIGPSEPEAKPAKPWKLEDDPLYKAKPLGRSSDGRAARDHDKILYGI